MDDTRFPQDPPQGAPQDPQDRPIPRLLDPTQRAHWRRLPFDGAQNFRDLGGDLTENGAQVKWGWLYRADKLSALTDADMTYMARLDIKTIIDFRSDNERREAPSRTDNHNQFTTHWLEVFEGGTFVDELWNALFSGTLKDAQELHDMLVVANQKFVSHHHAAFRNFMAMLLEEEKLPLLFHCMGGKDRTGFAAALVLTALGVSRDSIFEDYLKTNIYTAETVRQRKKRMIEALDNRLSDEMMEAVLQVRAEYLHAAFDAIDREYGGTDTFLADIIGYGPQEITELRKRYLETG